MCGIAGFLGPYGPGVATAMGAAIAHRGPDSDGVFADPQADIALVHRRLSIIDLSPAGDQPMTDASGRYTLVYNGEVYNYRALRRSLEAEGATFHGGSDTEVILEGFARHGTAYFPKLNGIFALAIWDREERTLLLARDGMGVKPLYLRERAGGFAFASEIKALLALPDLDRTLDRQAAAAYLVYNYSPGERTMFSAVRKLTPGSWLRIDRAGRRETGLFYRPPAAAPDHLLDDVALIAGTRATLASAVERQMVADVDVGAFLSGGLDSSAIVALARPHARGRMQCFTIGYDERADEAGELVPDLPYARQAAAHLDVDLHEVHVDARMADEFAALITTLDEPQADPAALNSLKIAALARANGIKVLLSGAGGDDVFTGYRRHQAAALDRYWGLMPKAARGALARGVEALPAGGTLGRRVRKLFAPIAGDRDSRLIALFEWLPPERAAALLVEPAGDVRGPLRAVLADYPGGGAVERVLRLEQHFFLADHNLNYTDKTGMASGVEIRVPFLDPELLDWAARVPVSAKLRGGETKWVLRKAMEPLLPHDIIYRPKTGFGVPLRAWLRRELLPMLEELLSPTVIAARGLFDPHAVTELKRDTLAGRIDGSYALLGLMAIELWCRHFADHNADVSVSRAA